MVAEAGPKELCLIDIQLGQDLSLNFFDLWKHFDRLVNLLALQFSFLCVNEIDIVDDLLI